MAEIVIKLVNGELAGKTMQEINKSVRDSAKELSKAKVGTEEWVRAHKKLEESKKLQTDLQAQIKGTAQASDELKKSFQQYVPFSGMFQEIGDKVQLFQSGVGGLISKFGLLKTAIIATGLGALIVALGSIVTWMKKTDDGATFLDGKMRALGGTVDVLLGRFANLGNGKFFDNLLRDLDEAIILGEALAVMYDDLDESRRNVELGTAKTEKEVNQLLLQSKNVALTYQQRLDLLEQASAKELADFELRKKLNEDFVALQQVQNAQAERNGTISDEQKDKLNELLVQQEKIANESIMLQEKIANRRSALLEKQSDEEQKAADERAKLQKEAAEKALAEEQKQYLEQLAALRTLEDLKVALMADGVDKQIARIELDTQRKIDAAVGSDQQVIDQILLLEQQKQQLITEVREKAELERKAKEEKAQKDSQAKAMADLELELATEQNNLNERWLNNQITNEEFLLSSEAQALAFQQRKMEMLRAAHGEESAEYQRARQEYLELQKETSDRAVDIKRKEMEDQAAAMVGALGTFGNFFGALASFQKQGTEQWKSFAVAAAIMSTIQGAINAYTSTLAIPFVGPALAPIAAGLALAAGYDNVRKIQRTKVEAPVKKARLGAVLHGPSHDQGGIPIEAEGGEIILTRGVYKNPRLRSMASDLNVAGGGIRFAAGGPVNPFSSTGGQSMQVGAAGAGAGQNDMAMVVMKLQAIEMTLAKWPTVLRVENVVTETDKAIKTINTIQEDADV